MLKITDFEKKILGVKANARYFYNTESQDIEETKEVDDSFLMKYPVYPQEKCFMQIKPHIVDLNAIGMDLINDFVKKNHNEELEKGLSKNDASYIFNLIKKDSKLLARFSKMMHANDFDKLYSLAKRYEIPLVPTYEFRRLARENCSLKRIALNVRHIAETTYIRDFYIHSTEANFKLQKRLYKAGYYLESYYIGIKNEPDHASFASYKEIAPNYVDAAYFMMKCNGAIDPEKKVDRTDTYIEILYNDPSLKDSIVMMFNNKNAVIEEIPEWKYGIEGFSLGHRYGFKIYEKPLPFRKGQIDIGQVLGKTKGTIKMLTEKYGRDIQVTVVEVTTMSPYVSYIPNRMSKERMEYYSSMGANYRVEVKIV